MVEPRRRRTSGFYRRRRRRAIAATLALVCVLAVVYGVVEANSSQPTRGDEAPVTRADTVEVASEETEPSRGTAVPEEPLPPPAESCDDPRVLVGKRHPLPPTYEPGDLVSLMAGGVPTYGNDQFVRSEALEPLSNLVSKAASDGQELIVLSAYRSYFEQQQNFAHFTGIYGEDAEIVSAPPGQSQHQLGTTVDFTNAEVGYQLLPAFGQTSASNWLEENAWRYGFVITYPDGDEQGTGRQWEPWEYRYIGEDLAERVYESDKSLREFLTEEGVRPLC